MRSGVSVVIRNRNEALFLGRTLLALKLQTIRPEIIVVDNESSDRSLELAEAAGARVVPLTCEEFSYGRALNRGVEAASHETIVLLSAHCVPLGPTFLEACLEPMADPQVAAASCLSLSATPCWVDGPWEGHGSAGWDIPFRHSNSCCVIQKSAWRLVRFDETLDACEDRLWAFQVIQAGYKVARSRAMFAYMRTMNLWEGIRKYNREQVATFQISGRTEPSVTIRDIMKTFSYEIPKSALGTAIWVCLRYVCVKTASLQARRRYGARSMADEPALIAKRMGAAVQ